MGLKSVECSTRYAPSKSAYLFMGHPVHNKKRMVQLLLARFQLALEKQPNDPFLQRRASFVAAEEFLKHINDLNISRVKLQIKV